MDGKAFSADASAVSMSGACWWLPTIAAVLALLAAAWSAVPVAVTPFVLPGVVMLTLPMTDRPGARCVLMGLVIWIAAAAFGVGAVHTVGRADLPAAMWVALLFAGSFLALLVPAALLLVPWATDPRVRSKQAGLAMTLRVTGWWPRASLCLLLTGWVGMVVLIAGCLIIGDPWLVTSEADPGMTMHPAVPRQPVGPWEFKLMRLLAVVAPGGFIVAVIGWLASLTRWRFWLEPTDVVKP